MLPENRTQLIPIKWLDHDFGEFVQHREFDILWKISDVMPKKELVDTILTG